MRQNTDLQLYVLRRVTLTHDPSISQASREPAGEDLQNDLARGEDANEQRAEDPERRPPLADAGLLVEGAEEGGAYRLLTPIVRRHVPLLPDALGAPCGVQRTGGRATARESPRIVSRDSRGAADGWQHGRHRGDRSHLEAQHGGHTVHARSHVNAV